MSVIGLKNQISFLDEISGASVNADKPQQFQLRPYQIEAVERGVRHLTSGKKPGIIVVPGGGGKSLIIANIAKQLDGHVLQFVPNKEILEQNYNKLMSYNTGIEVGIFSASMNQKIVKQITFVTIGSVVNKPELFKKFEYIIMDECDMGTNPYTDNMYKKFLNAIGDKRMIGTTATPYKLFANVEGAILRVLCRTRPRMFYDIIHHTQIQELSDAGYLCPCEYYRVGEFNVKNLKIGSSGEYTEDSVKQYYKEIKYDFSILDVAKRLINAGRKNLLVFTRFVEEARLLAEELGGIAAIVSGDTPKAERHRIISDFRSGKIKIVCNCQVLSVGFDFPELETILLARSTRSLRLLYQMVARGQRISVMKENCWIIDMADNLSRFPVINDIWLTKDSSGLWQYVDKGNNNKPITNVYF